MRLRSHVPGRKLQTCTSQARLAARPSLYSAWLRLWGARVGRLVYWSPGVALADRQWLRIGDRVVIGAGVRIVPHFLSLDSAGRRALSIGTVEIGDEAIIGGFSLVSAGAKIAPNAVTRPARPVRPFTRPASTNESSLTADSVAEQKL